MNRDTIFSIVSLGYGLGGQGWEHQQGQQIFRFSKTSSQFWGPPSLPISSYRGCSLEVKRPGHEVYHTAPFRAEAQNKWNYASTSHICLYGEDRDDFSYPQKNVALKEGGGARLRR